MCLLNSRVGGLVLSDNNSSSVMQPTILPSKSATLHVDGITRPSTLGMLLDGYPLEEIQLIKSGSWITYTARHPYLGSIALKILQVDNGMDALQSKKLQAEAERLRTLQCPCVLPLLNVKMEPRRLSLISKYMSNGSLHSLLYETMVNEKIEWSTSFRILYEISHGLHFLHNLSPPLPHGNLKPSNVLFDEKFHVKLSDAGLHLCRQLGVSHSHNRGSTSQPSSMTYCPPEAFSLGTVTSPSQDIYSLSVISWEVLSQKKPYKDTMDMVSMMAVVAGQRPDLSEEGLPATTPYRERVSQLLRRGWATLPGNRPDIQECIAELSCMYSVIQDDAIKQVHHEVGTEELQEKLIPLDLSNSPRMSCSIQGQPCPTQAAEGLENANEARNTFHSITSNTLPQSRTNDREEVPLILNIPGIITSTTEGNSESKICNIPSRASAMLTPLHKIETDQETQEEHVVPDEVQKVFQVPPRLQTTPQLPLSTAGAAKTSQLLLQAKLNSATSDTKRAMRVSSLAHPFQVPHCENHINPVLSNVTTKAAAYSGMALPGGPEVLHCSAIPNRNVPLALSSRNDEQFPSCCGKLSEGKAHLNDTSSNIAMETTKSELQHQDNSIIKQSTVRCLHCKNIHAVDSVASCWLQLWRESLVETTTPAILNKALDRMRANGLLEIENYEKICAEQTRMARVRALLDICQCLGDKAANVVAQVLKSNFVTPLSQTLSSSVSPR